MKSQVQTDCLCSIFSQNGLYTLKLLKINKKNTNNSIDIWGENSQRVISGKRKVRGQQTNGKRLNLIRHWGRAHWTLNQIPFQLLRLAKIKKSDNECFKGYEAISTHVFWTGNSINSLENYLALFCRVKNMHILWPRKLLLDK